MAKSNVEIGVSGIAEFKRGINDAKASLKALDAEAATAAAQFKASGDSQEYLATKAKLTQQQMAAQRTIIENCQKAMAKFTTEESKNSAAYQSLRAQMANAQTAMIGLQNQTEEAGDTMAEAATDTDRLVNAIGNIGKKVSFGNVLTVMKDIGNIAKNAVGAVVDFGKAIVSAGVDAAGAADDLATAAIQYDMTMRELQKWQLASNIFDADTQSIIKARSRMLDDAVKSTNGVLVLDADSTAFDVAVRDTQGNMRDIQDIFWDTVETLGSMEDATKRDAKAMELFGRSFLEVKTLFQEGAREKWTEILDSAGGNTDEEFGALLQLNDELDLLRYNASVAKTAAMASLAPGFERGAEAMNGFLEKLTAFTRSENAQKMFDSITDSITAFFDSITEEDIESAFDMIQNKILPGITNFFDGLPEKIQSTVESIGGISGALKTAADTAVWLSDMDLLNGEWLKGPEAWAAYREKYAEIFNAEKAASAVQGENAALDAMYGNNNALKEWQRYLNLNASGQYSAEGLQRNFGFGANAEENARLMQEYDERTIGYSATLEEYMGLATEYAQLMSTVPQTAADAIAEGIPDVESAAASMGAAVSAALAQNLQLPGGANTYNTSNNNTFNINNGLDAQAAMDYAAAVNQRQTAGYGG